MGLKNSRTMNVEREIAAMIRSIAQEKKEKLIHTAMVTEVAVNSCTVELISDGRIFENVSLHASEDEKDGLIITPALNSQVLIATVNGHDWFVCQYSKIAKVTLHAITKVILNAAKKITLNSGEDDGEKAVEINAKENVLINSEGKVEIKAGESIKLYVNKDVDEVEEDFGGLIKIAKLHEKLQKLENTFNDHTHEGSWTGSVPSVSGTVTNVTLKVPKISEPSEIFKNDYTDYKNEKITHT